MPLQPLPINRAPELVFGLVAPIGVDLELVSILNVTLREVRYDAHVLRLTTLMRAVGVTLPANLDPLSPEQSHISSYRSGLLTQMPSAAN